ncbi:50S ribosomal protein L7/L12 [Thermospira aquatica]|uniref:Large ribosomal subunit protein bL12 n=1 Tax=Thermospira aquatica TaxID=2828656 RepID=A0AAX3BEZ8_9SPIR|nr:50S ribosomal protein L7/L12 [Thermospira aquatica]URA10720.1 50S ribosomal protein L7/L12 [Thermospira aquatica]
MSDKINQVIDLISNMTVLELNELRKAIEEKFDVKAAAPVAFAGPMPAAGGAAAAAAEEPSTVSIFIKDPGAKKIEVIKVVRELTGLGLKEAKDLVESGGKTAVKENVEKAEGDKIKAALEAAGAVVEVK